MNLGLLVAALLLLWVVDSEWGHRRAVRVLRSPAVACWLLGIIVAWCVAGGLVPPQWATEGSLWQRLGFADFSASLGFSLLFCGLFAHLSLVFIHRLRKSRGHGGAAFLLTHGGLLLLLTGAGIGSTDRVEGRAVAVRDAECTTMFLRDGRQLPLGYGLHLEDFSVERSAADGSVVQYSATLRADSTETVALAVNHPYPVRWDEDIYLTGYDVRPDAHGHPAPAAVVMVVREPWKPVSMAGILLLAAGMVAYVFRRPVRLHRTSISPCP